MPPFNSCREIIFALLFILAAPAAFGQLATNELFRARTQQDFRHWQAAWTAAPDHATNAWQFARACFDWADYATNDTQRAEIARRGVAAAHRLIARNTNSAAGHYYLAMNDGQLAEAVEPSLEAFHLVNELEREFKLTAKLDPVFDHAGPARNLGLLYRDAPIWPLSVGSKHKAREFLESAAKLDPGYPGNQLNLAETQLRWREYDDARESLQKLEAIWPAAQTNFTGPKWDADWSDWTARRAAALTGFQKITGHAP
jgi:tetratricopeptide (TPR) repeat protein